MTHGQRRGWPSFCLRNQKNTPPVPLAAWVTSGHEKGPRETPGRRRCFSSEPSSSVIHAAHAAHAAALGERRSFLLRMFGDRRLGGDDQTRDRRGVLEGRAQHLGRIDNAERDEIAVFAG